MAEATVSGEKQRGAMASVGSDAVRSFDLVYNDGAI